MDTAVYADGERDSFRSRLMDIVARMRGEAEKRVSRRKPYEDQWVIDAMQYHGIYEGRTATRIAKLNGSTVNINQTGPKTDALTARLQDLLFSNDERNWEITPTKVPTLTEAARIAAQKTVEFAQQAEQAAAQGDPAAAAKAQADADAAAQVKKTLDAQKSEAAARAERMADVIEDQLSESQYHAAMRDMIEQAAKFGTGVCKGPITGDRVRKGWKKTETGEYALEMSEGYETPAIRWVDLWSFFPDMDVADVRKGNGVYERHLYNARDLRKLAMLPGFDRDAIARLIRGKPKDNMPQSVVDLRNIHSATADGRLSDTTGNVYTVWEYTGPLDLDDVEILASAMNDDATLAEIEADPLAEMQVIVWFCGDELLKFAIYPYDSMECLYSVFNLRKDEYSVFGRGIPYIMRDAQAVLNAAWRAMMDNAALGSGPLLFVDRKAFRDQTGAFEMRPRGVYEFDGDDRPSTIPPVLPVNIPMNQVELANIIVLAQRFIDEVTAMPAIAQGELGAERPETAHGTSMRMNAAAIPYKRIVKNFDDDVTVPNIRRFYDWNMQFNPREDIKGDHEVVARGSSVLLVREMQAGALGSIMANFSTHPVFGVMMDAQKAFRQFLMAVNVRPDDLMLPRDEIEAVVAKQAAQAAQQQQQAMQMQQMAMQAKQQFDAAKLQIEQMKVQVADVSNQRDNQTELQKAGLTYEKDVTVKRAEIDQKDRQHAVELAVTQKIGPTGGGTY